MTFALQKPIHLSDYLSFDNASQQRHEYTGGYIQAMTGGTMRHNRLSLNVARVLSNRLDATPCQVFINDMKLHVQAADSVYYPDVFVFCGGSLANNDDVAHDAKLVVEVLSESTAGIDRREKLIAYRKLPSILAYWIVSQTEQRVEVHSRGADGQWQALAYGAGESIAVDWLGSEPFSLASMYAGTDMAG